MTRMHERKVGRTPWSAADALVGLLLAVRVQGDPARTRGSATLAEVFIPLDGLEDLRN